jgi:hypothetical protein
MLSLPPRKAFQMRAGLGMSGFTPGGAGRFSCPMRGHLLECGEPSVQTEILPLILFRIL